MKNGFLAGCLVAFAAAANDQGQILCSKKQAGGAATAGLAMVLISLARPRKATIESVEARYESRAMNHEWG